MPRPFLTLFLLGLSLSFTLGHGAPAAPESTADECCEPSLITATDLLKIKQLSAPALSPDGRWVAYVVRSIEPKPAVKDDWVYQSNLWLAATDGRTPPRQLTRSGNSTSPAWSPDGTQLAFVRSVEKEKPQIHLLPLAGGEAAALTKLETGATAPRWSPDGKTILFSSTLTSAQIRAALEKSGAPSSPAWSLERPGRQTNDTANWGLKSKGKSILAEDAAKAPKSDPDGTPTERREWLARNEADGNPRLLTRLSFFGESDLQPDLEIVQLYTIEVRDGAEPKAVAPGFVAYTEAQWTADGAGIVCTGPRQLDEHPDRDRLSSLYLLDPATGAARVLLDRAEEDYGNPQPSPDGQWIAFTWRTGGVFSFDQPSVALLPTAGGEPRLLTRSLDRPANHLRWSADSSSVYFLTANEGTFPLYRVAIGSGEVRRLTPELDRGIAAFDAGREALVLVVNHPANPAELQRTDLAAQAGQTLTTHNSAWLDPKKLSAYEAHSFVNKEGLTIAYWTMKPTDFDPAKKYPLLLQIHGGPSAMWGPGETSMWHEFQYYAAQGYVVVFANPRGSGGYGRDFQYANFKDWGTGPASDVLAAAGFAAKAPYVDADRQVLTGGSYGGYLTAWIIAHDHRFKAAVTQRGVYDLRTFFGEGNAWQLVPRYWGGNPWEEKVRPLLERDSPINYVDRIATPLLIQHGDVDLRTGVMQSQMLYRSLKALQRPVEYVRYPRATHEMSRSGEPKQRLDSLVRYEEFFRRYIGQN